MRRWLHQLVARTELDNLKKSCTGELALYFLDETGFSLCLPPTHTWCRRGRRLEVPHERLQGQRVNVVAALRKPQSGFHRYRGWTVALV